MPVSDFVDDLATLPTVSDAPGLSHVPTPGYIVAENINDVSDAAVSLRTAILAGKKHGLRNNGTPDVPVAGAGAAFFAENNHPTVGVGGAGYTAGFLMGVSVRAMGAKGDGSTSDTAAFNAAVTRAKLLNYRTIYVQEGQYLIDGLGVDCTGITSGLSFRANPGAIAQIKLSCTARAGFDFTGSLFCRMENLWIEGNSSSTPAAAILCARNSTNGSAGGHIFSKLIITGYYSKAAVASISSESNEWVNCDIVNFKSGVYGTFALTDQNDTGITSSYATFPATWSGGNTVTRFLGGRIGVTGGAGTEHGITLKNARGVSFTGTFFDGGTADSCIYVAGDVTGLSIKGGSSESQTMVRGTIVVKAGVVLSDLSVKGFVAYRPLYGEDTSIIRHADVHAQFYGIPDYGVDVSILENSTVSSSEFGCRVRSKAYNNTFWGTGQTAAGAGGYPPSLPTDSSGNVFMTDVLGSDGRRRPIYHIGDQGLYAEASAKWLSADLIRTRIKKIAASSYGAGFSADLSAHGAYIDVTLDAGLVLLDFAAAGPFGNLGTKDEGVRVTFLFRQDATGGRNVVWPASLKNTDKFTVRKAANAVTVVEFMLDPDNLWQLVHCSAPLYGTATWDPASTADGAFTSTTLTVTGAAVGDAVSLGFSVAVPAGALLVGSVTAAGTVTATLFNKTGGALDLASGTLTAVVTKA